MLTPVLSAVNGGLVLFKGLFSAFEKSNMFWIFALKVG
ncbi:hypothetical protein DGWBC_1189 [Dehalogenimonas sp. WBC-2]|nr:hypothetical protein DGWBC_1189 [Dehalogenimonas sp. WBC-2]